MARLYLKDSDSVWAYAYDCAMDKPFDTRSVIANEADRLVADTWKIGPNYYHYNGMITVASDTGNVWVYTGANGNVSQVVDASYWKQIGGGAISNIADGTYDYSIQTANEANTAVKNSRSIALGSGMIVDALKSFGFGTDYIKVTLTPTGTSQHYIMEVSSSSITNMLRYNASTLFGVSILTYTAARTKVASIEGAELNADYSLEVTLDEDLGISAATNYSIPNEVFSGAAASISMGANTLIGGQSQVVLGTANFSDSSTSALIGVGNSAIGQRNFGYGMGNTMAAVGDSQLPLDNMALGHYNLIRKRAIYDSRASYALGYNNMVYTRGVALGYSNQLKDDSTSATAQSQFAFGEGNVVNGNYSFALGYNLNTTQNGEYALGRYNVSRAATESVSGTLFTIGIGTDSTRKNLLEFTNDTKIYLYGIGSYNGTNVGSSGVKDLATVISEAGGGDCYITESSNGGYYLPNAVTTSSPTVKQYGFSCGYQNTVDGDYGFACGASNTAGWGSLVTGSYNSASNSDGVTATIVGGSSNTLDGNQNCIVVGMYNSASGDESAVFGNHNQSTQSYELVTGRFNLSNSNSTMGNTAFTIGGGTSASARKNLFEVRTTGSVFINGMGNYDGTNGNNSATFSLIDSVPCLRGSGFRSGIATSATNYGWAFGGGCTVTGGAAVAFGNNTTVGGQYSLVQGTGSTVNGQYSIVNGSSQTVAGNYNIVNGQSNTVNATNSLNIGSGNTTSGSYNTTVGSNNENRGSNCAFFGSHIDSINSSPSYCFATGTYNMVYGYYNTAIGYYTYVGAEYDDDDDVVSYSIQGAFAAGYQLRNLANYSACFGNANRIGAYGSGNFVAGDSNTISNGASSSSGTTTYSAIFGHNNTITSGSCLTVTGNTNSVATSSNTSIEGYSNSATGSSHCHIEGSSNTISSKSNAHVEGIGNTATTNACHVEGTYSYTDTSMIHVTGVGTSSSNKLNAFAIGTDGKVYIKGVGGYTGQSSSGATDLATALSSVGGESFVTHTSATLSIDTSTITGNTYYDCTTALTSLSVTHTTASPYEVTIHFTAGTGFAKSFTPTSFKVLGLAAAFEIVDGKEYELSIKNDIFVLSDINTVTA